MTALFEAGHTEVILDVCNNTVKRREEWKYGPWNRVFAVVRTSAEECVNRVVNDESMNEENATRLLTAIKRMSDQHEPVTEEEGPVRYVGEVSMGCAVQ